MSHQPQSGSELPRHVRRLGIAFVLIGVTLFALAVWGLWRDVSWIAQPFYAWAWWGYILCLDGLCALIRGHSLLTVRLRHALPIALWSITFWFCFELLNIRFQNWYYVGAFDPRTSEGLILAAVFVMLCFSTVFIGIFETTDALSAVGFLKRWKSTGDRRGAFPGWVSWAVQALGVVMATLAVLFPYYLAPLIWGSLTFVIDPWNYRRGARSILRDFENRDFGLVARILVAGFLCGLIWESLNFFAPQKWIYTVRGLESLKLFEMPILGFLGFPGLALDSLAAWAFVSYWLFGNETWEAPEDLSYALTPRPRRRLSFHLLTLPLHVLFWGAILFGVQQVNIGSFAMTLSDLPSFTSKDLDTLRSRSIDRPVQFLRSTRDPASVNLLAVELDRSVTELHELIDEAELFTFKGIGPRHGRGLKLLGISTVDDVARWEPDVLHRELVRQMDKPPRLDMVRVWVLAARGPGLLQRVKER